MENTSVGAFAERLMRELELAKTITEDDVEHAVTAVAKKIVKELHNTSPIYTGLYAGSWTYKQDKFYPGKDYLNAVVYSAAPHHGKTHLLENGHYAADGSFVKAYPHIESTREKAEEWMQDELTKNLSG